MNRALRRLARRRKQERARRDRACRPRLERLEDRLLLATIGLNQVKHALIAAPSEIDSYSLVLSQAERVAITVATDEGFDPLSGALAQLRDGTGTLLAESDVPADDARMVDLDLAAGSYTITVQAPSSDATRVGTYQLHVANQDPVPQDIQFGEAVAGQLLVANQVQDYALNIPAGQTSSFAVTAHGDVVDDLLIEVLDPNGITLADSWSSGGYDTERIPDVAPYGLRSAGNRNVRYLANLGDNSLLANDVDLYRIDLRSGDLLTAGIGAQGMGLSGLNGVLRVFDSTGAELAVQAGGAGVDPALVFMAPADGAYFVGVSSAGNVSYDGRSAGSGSSGGTTGDYQILLARTAASDVLITDAGDTLSTAYDLALGPSESLQLPAFLGDNAYGSREVDLFRVALEPGDLLSVGVLASSVGLSSLNGVAALFDSSGQLLMLNDDLVGQDPGLNYLADTAGSYYIGVTSSPNFGYDPTTAGSGTGGGSQGAYQLLVSRSNYNGNFGFQDVGDVLSQAERVDLSAADPSPAPVFGDYIVRVSTRSGQPAPFELEISDRATEAPRPAEVDEFVPGTLEYLGDEDLYTIDALAGDVMTIAVQGTNLGMDLQLIGPGGVRAAEGDFDDNVTITMPVTGTYTALVRSAGDGDGVGTYVISASQPHPAAQPIGFGQQQPGRIHVPGDFAVYELQVGSTEVGRTVSITHSAVGNAWGEYRPRMDFFAPDGSLLATRTHLEPYAAFELRDIVLPAEGTYTLRVVEEGNDETGTFTIGISDQPVVPSRPLPAINTEITGSLQPLGDVDAYKFSGTAGRIITVQLDSVAGGDFDLTLLGPAGQVVAGSGYNDSSLPLVTLAADGDYTLEIRAAGDHILADPTGEYRFAVWTPDRQTAPVPIGFGETRSVSLDTPGDIVDLLLHVGPEHVGQFVSIGQSSVETDSWSYTPRLELYDPAGSLVTETSSSRASGALELDDVLLTEAGDYIIRVTEANDAGRGALSVGVSDQPVASALVLPAFNREIRGAIERLSDVDEYMFTGQQGQVITAELQSGYFDFTLLDSQGAIIAGDTDYDDILELVTLPQEDTYTLRIEPAGGAVSSSLDDVGEYSLVVWTPHRDPVPVPITFGQSLPATVAVPGDVVTYALDVTAEILGRPVSINRTRIVNGNGYGFKMELAGPDGTVLETTSNTTYAVAIDDVVLTEAGTYTITVSDSWNHGTGSFSVSVNDEPVETATEIDLGSRIPGLFEHPGDTDDFQFTSTTGDPVTIGLATYGYYVDAHVLDPAGTEVAGANGLCCSTFDFTPVVGIAYTLQLESTGSDGNSRPYLVSISDATHPVTDGPDEPADVPLSHGEVVTGMIRESGDIDTLIFTGQRGDRIHISLSTGLVPNSGLLEVDMRLVGPGDIELSSEFLSSAYTYGDSLDFVLPADGDYRMTLQGKNDNTGPYAVAINNRRVESQQIAPLTSGTVAGGSLATMADEDWYSFNYHSGDVIQLAVTNTYNDEPLEVVVYSPIGSLLYHFQGYQAALGERTLPVEGEYTVLVRAVSPMWTDYVLHFDSHVAGEPGTDEPLVGEPPLPIQEPAHSKLPPVPELSGEPPTILSPVPDAQPGLDMLGPTALGYDETFIGRFPSGAGQQTFELAATAGDVLRVSLENIYDFAGTLELYDPDGVLVFSASNTFEAAIQDLTTSKTGSYRLVVQGSGEGGFALSASNRALAASTELQLDGPPIADRFVHNAAEHVYHFSVSDPTVVELAVYPLFEVYDVQDWPDLLVYSPQGQLIPVDEGSGREWFQVRTQWFVHGDYQLVVRTPLISSEFGAYIMRLSSAITPTLTPEPDGTIGFGQSVDGELAVAGDDFQLTLDVAPEQVGKAVSIVHSSVADYSSSDYSPILEFYSPDGLLLTTRSNNRPYNALEIDDFVMPVEGTYTIRVSEEGNDATGSFTIGVSDQAVEPPAVLADFNTEVSGAVSPMGDVDEYAFDAVAGESVLPQLTSGSFEMSLLDGQGKVLASGLGDFPRLVKIPSDGTYTLRIEPGDGWSSWASAPDTTGNYQCVLWKPNRHPTPVDIDFGQTAPGEIQVPGDWLEYSFDVTASEVGHPVSIVHSSVQSGSSWWYYAHMELYAPDGTLLTERTGWDARGPIEIDDFVLPTVGTYILRISEVGDHATGSFTVGLSDQPVASPLTLPAFNTEIPASIDPMGDVDEFAFEGNAGQIITAQLVSGYFDLTLFAPDGSVLAGGGDSETLLELIELPSDGTYVLRVEPPGPEVSSYSAVDVTGDYSLAVWTPNREPAPIAVQFGESQPGEIAVPGDVVEYALTVATDQVGRLVSIVHSSVTTNDWQYEPRLELYGPDGALLTWVAGATASKAIEIDDFPLPVAGTYTIQVTDRSGSANGTFNIGVSDQPSTDPVALTGFNTSVNEAIEPLGDVDEYTFPAVAGDVVTVEQLAGQFELTLLGPDGEVVAQTGPWDRLLKLVTLPSDGTYTVRLEPAGGQVSERLQETANYSLVVWKPDHDPVPVSIGFDEARQTTVAVPGDVVAFSFDVTPAEVGRPVSIVHSEVADNASYRPRLELWGPDESLLAVRGTQYSSLPMEIGDFVLPAAGTYVIRAYEIDDDQTGSLTIGLSDQPLATGQQLLTPNGGLVTTEIMPVGDIDEYQFQAAQGDVFNVSVNALSTNLRLSLKILDSLGAVRARLPGAGNLQLDEFIAPADDTYTIRVEPEGDPASQYLDETGQYTIQLTQIASAPNLQPSDVTPPTGGGIHSGDAIQISYTVTNVGNSATDVDSWADQVVLSANTILGDADDVILGTLAHTGLLAAGQSYVAQPTVTLPEGISGDFYLMVTADINEQVSEVGREDDNTTSSAPFTIEPAAYPDLVVEQLQAAVPSGSDLPVQATISWTSHNQGTAATPANWQERLVVRNLTSGQVVTDQLYDYTSALAAGGSQPATATINFERAGRYEVSVTTDSSAAIYEFNHLGHDNAEQNNTTTAQFVVEGPDLIVSAISAPVHLLVGNPAEAQISWTVANQGAAVDSVSQWQDAVMFSFNDVLGDGDDLLLASVAHDGQLLPTATYDASHAVTLPENLRGDFFVYVITDSGHVVNEPDGETNNASEFAAIHMTIPHSDLVVEAVSTADAALSGDTIPIKWRVGNHGVSPTNAGSWIDRLVLSDDDVLDAADLELARLLHGTALEPGANYMEELAVALPEGISGDYFVFAETDIKDGVFEGDFENNNARRTLQPIHVTRRPDPDLRVTVVDVDPGVRAGDTIPLTWTVANAGDGTARGPWIDRWYLTPSGQMEGAVYLGDFQRDEDVAPGTSYSVTADWTVPAVTDGTYYVLLITDAADSVFEGDHNDNNAAASSAITLAHVDLVPSIDSVPASAVSGTEVSMAWSVANQGTAAADGLWLDRVFLSSDNQLSADDRMLLELAHANPLDSTDAYSELSSLKLPQSASGTRYLLLVTDAENRFVEPGKEDNNIAVASMQIQLAPYADLGVSDVQVAELIVGDPAEVTVDWKVSNIGTGRGAVDQWIDRIIASSDDQLGDYDDVVLAEVPHTGGLDVSQSYTEHRTFRLPPAFQGRYQLFVQTDADDAVFENFSEANNVAVAPNFFDVVRSAYADLAVTALDVPATATSGRPMPISWSVQNQGLAATDVARWEDMIRLARNPDGSDIIAVPYHSLDIVGRFQHLGRLSPNQQYDRSETVPLPDGLTGSVYVVITTGDPTQTVGPFEFVHTDNNTHIAGPVEVSLTPPPDLTVTDITVPDTALAGTGIDVGWTVKNEGPGDTAGRWADTVYLHDVSQPDADPLKLGTFYHTDVTAGQSYSRREVVYLPSRIQGSFQIEVRTNQPAPGIVQPIFEDGRTANNTLMDDQTFIVGAPELPDLQVLSITAPDSVQAGGTGAFEFVVINQSPIPAKGHWQDAVYLSVDNVLSHDDIEVGRFENPSALAYGETYSVATGSVDIPKRYSGEAFVIVKTDVADAIDEYPAEENNVSMRALQAIPLPPSDLVTSDVIAPAQAWDGGEIEVRFTVTNLGAAETNADRWTDSLWLSRDRNRPHPCAGDMLIGTFPHYGALLEDQSYEQKVTVRIPTPDEMAGYWNSACDQLLSAEDVPVPGQWHITPWSDAYDDVVEDTFDVNINPDDPNELDNNNYKARPITLLRSTTADLVVRSVVPDAHAVGGGELHVRWTVENQGSSEAVPPLRIDPETGEEHYTWTDAVYLSDEPDLRSPTARVWELGKVTHDGVLGIGAAYTADATFALSPEASGDYVIVVTDGDKYSIDLQNTIWEGSFEDNNDLAAPTDVTTRPADLRVTSVAVLGDDHRSGKEVTVQWEVTNFGEPVWEGTPYWKDFIYVSADEQFIRDRAIAIGSFIHSNDQPLGTGERYERSETVILPRGLDGTYFIHVATDPLNRKDSGYPLGPPYHQNNRTFYTGYQLSYTGDRLWDPHVYEGWTSTGFNTGFGSAEEDNVGTSAVDVIYDEPDLRIHDVEIAENSPKSGQIIHVSWDVTNEGTASTYPDLHHSNWVETLWYDRVYLSRDPSLDSSDWLLGTTSRQKAFTPPPPLSAGSTYHEDLPVALPVGIEGNFYLLVRTDSNIETRFGSLAVEDCKGPPSHAQMRFNAVFSHVCAGFESLARVQEFENEDDNMLAVPITVELAPSPDLQVTSVFVPQSVRAGQPFELIYRVENLGAGDTQPGETWNDLIYLSRDQNLDLRADEYLGEANAWSSWSAEANPEPKSLPSGQWYEVTQTVEAPADLTGPYYVFVVTDPIRSVYQPRGGVFELDRETNNTTSSPQPLIIELPPPADLQVDLINVPPDAQAGDTITASWTVTNYDHAIEWSSWSDAVYLSEDAVWDLHDRRIGQASYTTMRIDEYGLYEDEPLKQGDSYTLSVTATLPPATPGTYRLIVRPDIFDEIYEDLNEANNRAASVDTFHVTVDELHLGVPLETTLDVGQERLYQLTVDQGQTLRVSVTGQDHEQAANDLFLRYGALPSGTAYDAASDGRLQADKKAVVPSTDPGVYYVLLRGHSEPASGTPVTLLAEVLPFAITDVVHDRGGDSRWVTTTIRGAQFHPDAIVKLVRPGFAEFEPASYEVIDNTKIIATFDPTDAPHGLYDLKVINPDGQEAIVPYRYLVERAIEPDVTIGMGGPPVLSPGDGGVYSVTVENLSNIHTPYTYVEFGIPELGTNQTLGMPYVAFASNVHGAPESSDLADLPWASLDSAVNTDGQILAPGYVLDLPNDDYVRRTFTAQTYPGLAEILAKNPNYLRDLTDDCFEIAFRFHISAAATAMTREEFVQHQTEEAERLRTAILADQDAAPSLVALAADSQTWTDLYLAALKDAGLLRPAEDAPAVREDPLIVSQMAMLAGGILAGPAGEEILGQADLVGFFSKIRSWYGHDPDLLYQEIGGPATEIPDRDAFELGLSRTTHFEAFRIYVPYGKCRVDAPEYVDVEGVDFGALFGTAEDAAGRVATLTGPAVSNAEQFLPAAERLPYTINFRNPADNRAVAEVRVVTQLDPSLALQTFRLGDLKLGQITVHLPQQRGSFQGDFDFVQQLGFIVRVSAGVDLGSGVASWLLQAIDPDTGTVIQDRDIGLLPAAGSQRETSSFVSYSVAPKPGLETGTPITASAQVLFDHAPPEDTNDLNQQIDGHAPTTTLTAQPLAKGSSHYLVQWNATDDPAGSGVKHVTVYVAQDGGDFQIWQRQTTETSAVYQGEPGHDYEFLALATDQACNQEKPPLGVAAPDDGSGTFLGLPPDEGQTEAPQVLPPPEIPGPVNVTNRLYLEAQQGIPAPDPPYRPAEFSSVVRPFTAEAFAIRIRQSHADIGPMAIAVMDDQTVLVSGGAARNQLYRLSAEGGAALAPLAILPYPVFDMQLAEDGRLWATTGGGPLLELDATTGSILAEYGDGITQSLAIQPETGEIYVSTGDGIAVFDPQTSTFESFSPDYS